MGLENTHMRPPHLSEGGTIPLSAVESSGFPYDKLEQFPDGHSTGKSVGVHDQVWNYTQLTKREVLLANDDTAYALLSVARTKLVANLRASRLAQRYFHQVAIIVIPGEHHAIN